MILAFISIKTISQETFPTSWEGNYKGELQIYGVDSIAMRVTMKLDIQKKTDSIYQWKITYDLKDKKRYSAEFLMSLRAEHGKASVSSTRDCHALLAMTSNIMILCVSASLQ